MISFANPSWMYGLLGLLIPIGIHLLSRKEGKTIYIGSIRHLTDSDTAQFSSIRLNEILLLLLRMLLIALVVFILAGFRFNNGASRSKQWLLIEKGIERDKAYSPTIDSLKLKGFDVRWLSEDFPLLADSTSIDPVKNYSQLIHSLPSFLDTTVVMTYGYASAFKGEKQSLPENVLWLTVDPSQTNIAIDAVEVGADSVAVRLLSSSATGSEISNQVFTKVGLNNFPKTDSLQIEQVDTINISIYASEAFAYDSKIIQATLRAIASRTPHHLNIVKNKASDIPGSVDFLFWLSKEKAPEAKVSIGYSSCQNSSLPLLVSRERAIQFCPGANSNWIITQHLTEENVLNESLTYMLANIILPKVDSKSFVAFDHRTFPSDAVFSKTQTSRKDSRAKNETKAGNEPALAVLLFMLLLAERFIAYKRQQ